MFFCSWRLYLLCQSNIMHILCKWLFQRLDNRLMPIMYWTVRMFTLFKWDDMRVLFPFILFGTDILKVYKMFNCNSILFNLPWIYTMFKLPKWISCQRQISMLTSYSDSHVKSQWSKIDNWVCELINSGTYFVCKKWSIPKYWV